VYGLPEGIDLTFFAHKMLIQVCIGAHDLILNFEGGINISIASCIEMASPTVPSRRYEDFRQASSALVALITRSVASAAREDAGTLTLLFEGGERVSVFDDSTQYESYTIRHGEELIVV